MGVAARNCTSLPWLLADRERRAGSRTRFACLPFVAQGKPFGSQGKQAAGATEGGKAGAEDNVGVAEIEEAGMKASATITEAIRDAAG